MKIPRFRPHFLRLLVIVLWTMGALLGAGGILAAPTVTANTAALAANAMTLTINGTGFATAPAFDSVAFSNGASGSVTAATATQLTVALTTAPFAGNLTAVVTCSGVSSGAPVQVATVQLPVAQFYTANQSALASNGTFAVTVNLSALPNIPLASGIHTPTGMAYDKNGNLFVADQLDNLVYKVTSGGTVSVFASGFSAPWGLAFDSAGNLYVANYNGNTVSVVTPAGAVSPFASGFNRPEGLAFDSAGNLYVVNHAGNTLSKVTPGGVVSAFATGLAQPCGVAIDAGGNLYVSDSYIGGSVSKVTPAGVVSTFAGPFNQPAGLAFDNAGNLLVANNANSGVGYVPTLCKITPAGVVSTVLSAGLVSPVGVACDASGNPCLGDQGRSAVTKVFARVSIPVTLGGTAVAGTDYSGVTASPLTFNYGQSSATISGTLLLNPAATSTPRTLKMTLGTPTGALSGSVPAATLTILQPPLARFGSSSQSINASAGTFSLPVTLSGASTFGGNALPTATPFASGLSAANALACDAAGNIYVATSGSTIGKLSPGGALGPFATGFSDIVSLVFDAAGTLYVADEGTESVSKVSPAGQATVVASGFDRMSGIGVDAVGNIYVTSYLGINYQNGIQYGWGITKIAPGGASSIFAYGFNSFLTSRMVFDAAGNLYCGSQDGSVYQITPLGTYSLFANAFNYSTGLVIDGTGDLYVCDANHGISMITPAGVVSTVAGLQAADLAIDSAGNLYAGTYDGTVTKYLPTVNVPFTLSGTAVAGKDYASVPASPLTFVNGQTTAAISGTLLTDAGAARTLTAALGAVTGVSLGSPTATTLTVTESASAATVQFLAGSEQVNETTGQFSIVVTATGTATPTFAGGASPTITSLATGLSNPSYLVTDHSGNVYAANNGAGTVSKITSAGAVSKFASGFGSTAGLALDSAGNLYVASASANTVSKVTSSGSVSLFASGFNIPAGLAFDASGNLYVANTGANSVSKVTAGGVVSTFSVALNAPQGLAFDSAGYLYVANGGTNTIVKVAPGGSFYTFAAGLNNPRGLAFDTGGNLYVGNQGGNTVSRISPSGLLTTLASTLTAPIGLAFDTTGNLYVSSTGTGGAGIVSKLTPSVTVALTLGGTAVAGLDYSGVSSGYLVFTPGQARATITGTLLPDPGANQTLILTLGNAFGASTGSTSTNTLTVTEPPASLTASAASLPITAPSIVLNGLFNPAPANNTVTFNNGAAGTVTSATTTALTVALTTPPAKVGSLTAKVVSAGQITSTVQVATVIPVVTATATVISLGSNTVTISGAGFDPMAANNSVQFNDGAAGTISAATATQLTVTFTTHPAGSGNLTAIVTTDGLGSGAPVQVATVQPAVQFSLASESANQSANVFNVAVSLTGNPAFAGGAALTAATYASGITGGLAFDSAGNLYVLANGVTKVAPNGVVTSLTTTNFNVAQAIAVDTAGNVYVATYYIYGNYPGTIMKVTPAGVVSTFVASGVNQPTALAFDASGNLYVANSGDGTISKVTPAGVVSTFASTGLTGATALAFDAGGNLFLAHPPTGTIRKITPGGVLSTFASGFAFPAGLAFDAAGLLYVSDTTTSTVTQLTPAGVVSPTFSWASLGYSYSHAANYLPSSLAFDSAGNLYVAGNNAVTRILPTVIVPFTLGGTAMAGVDYSGVVSPLRIVNGQTPVQISGQMLLDPGTAPALTFTLGTPTGASLGAQVTNTLTMVEPATAATVQFNQASETIDESTGKFSIGLTITGIPAPSFAAGSGATVSTFTNGLPYYPSASFLAFDAAGNLYVSNKIYGQISKVSPAGAVSTFASGFSYPEGLAFDSAGNLYVANSAGNSISKVTPAGAVSTFVSAGPLSTPIGLAFDTAGNLYVANTSGNTVSKVTPAGVISTFATGFNQPQGLAFDSAGNLYVANTGNNTVSKVTPAGAISLFASGVYGPEGLAFDSAGNLFVVNYLNGSVSRVTPAGVVSVLVSGFSSPYGIAFDNSGNFYVANYSDYTISKVSPSASVQFTVGGTVVNGADYNAIYPTSVTFAPGQTTGTISGTLLANPGASKTLTLTLNTPNGMALGATATNTLTITEPPPSITASTASLPINATTITLQGLFNATAANNTVTFNNGATGTVVTSGGIVIGGHGGLTSLTVTLTKAPTVVGPLLATVTAGGQSSSPVQVATVAPVVTSMTAGLALNASTLTINGSGFDPIAANNSVTFNNGATGTVTAASSTQLTVTLTTPPTKAGALTAIVTTDGQSSGVAVPVGTAEPLVQFATDREGVDPAVSSTFSIPVTLSARPTFDNGVSPVVSTFATGFNQPSGLAFDAAGNLYVANFGGGTVSRVTPAGAVSTFASGFPHGYYYSAPYPYGLTFDAAGNLYVALFGNDSISKVTPAGVISDFALDVSGPRGLVADTSGNIYVTDLISTDYAVSQVTPSGAVSTFAATQIQSNSLAIDTAGNLYVGSLPYSGGGEIDKMPPGGSLTPLAVNIAAGPGIDGMAVDATGNVYFSNGQAVSKVTPSGVLSSLVGGFNTPSGLAFDAAGNLYVGETGTNSVREVSAAATVSFTTGGTAVQGTDYTGLTVGPLVFVNGQPMVYITGTLLPHAGPAKTLTFTLASPAGAFLGATTQNTLTIGNAPAVTASAANLPGNNKTITIQGSGFDPLAANNTVTFNDGAIGQVIAASATQLTVRFTQPPGALGTLTALVSSDGISAGTPVQVASVGPFASVAGVSMAGGRLTLSFMGVPNTAYGLQYTATMSPPSWTNIGPVITDGAGACQYGCTVPGAGAGFFRLVYPAP